MVTDKLPDISERFDISLLVMFGSHAKGTAKPGGDVDIGVWLAAPTIKPILGEFTQYFDEIRKYVQTKS